MTPQKYIDELSGVDKYIFGKLYAGSFSEKLYRLFEYKKCKTQFVGLACCLEKMSSKSIVYSVFLQRKKEKGMLNRVKIQYLIQTVIYKVKRSSYIFFTPIPCV